MYKNNFSLALGCFSNLEKKYIIEVAIRNIVDVINIEIEIKLNESKAEATTSACSAIGQILPP